MLNLHQISKAVLVAAAGTVFAASAIVNADEVVVDEVIEIPEVEFEVITAEPSNEYVWIDGYWEREPDEWTWVAGRWEKPPHKKARWIDGHWKYDEGKWYWHHGQWALQDWGYIVDEYIEIPDLLDEERPERPSDEHHWVAGYWEWDGTWFWVPGYWTLRENPKAEWVPGHWDPYGLGGWRWISGHWNVR